MDIKKSESFIFHVKLYHCLYTRMAGWGFEWNEMLRDYPIEYHIGEL